jgi:hypothetical protein
MSAAGSCKALNTLYRLTLTTGDHEIFARAFGDHWIRISVVSVTFAANCWMLPIGSIRFEPWSFRGLFRGKSMVKVIGGLVLIAGIFLFIGNVSGGFRTFPGAGYLTIALGGVMLRAGNA